MARFAESTLERAALDWLQALGYSYAFGPDLAFDGSAPERKNYEDMILLERLKHALVRLNPAIPEQARMEAFLHAGLKPKYEG